MTRKTKLISTLLSLTISLSFLTLTACKNDSMKSATVPTPENKTVVTTESTTEIPEYLQTPTPTPDADLEARDQARMIASAHGLTDEQLMGEYALFLRFANTIDGNDKLGGYDDVVYAIFPTICQQISPEREGHLLARLGTLRIFDNYPNEAIAGAYQESKNEIAMNAKYKYSPEVAFTSSLFHELIHFVDTNIDGDIEDVRFCQNGVFPVNDLDGAQTSANDIVQKAYFIKEGCAELYTAKYFMMATDSYQILVQFFTGLEHIAGAEMVQDMIFAHDSAYRMAAFLMEHGFSEGDVLAFFQTMDCVTYYYYPPANSLRPEDVLIQLYEEMIGPDYLSDPVFCHILRSCYVDLYNFDILPSTHQDVLESLIWTREQSIDWLNSILVQLDNVPEFDTIDFPMRGLYLNGKFQLSAVVAVYNSPDDVQYEQILIIDYDFNTEKALSYEIRSIPYEMSEEPKP